MNKNHLSPSMHVYESLKPQNLLLRLLLTGQGAQLLNNDIPPLPIGNPITHTQTYHAPNREPTAYGFPYATFQNNTAAILLENPEDELGNVQDALQSITHTFHTELDDSISQIESMRGSFSPDEQQLITTYVQEHIGPEFPSPHLIQSGMFDFAGIRELAKNNPRYAALIILIIAGGVAMFVSNKGENLGHTVGGAIKNKSRPIGRLAGGAVGAGLGYAIIPEFFDNILKPIKSIPIFQYIPLGQAAWFVAVIVLLKMIPIIKKLPWYGKGIVALLLSARLYGNITLDPKAIIKNKNTGQPVMQDEKQEDDDTIIYDEDGNPLLLSPQAEAKKTEQDTKKLDKYIRKLEGKQASLLSEIRMLRDVREVKGYELTTSDGKLLWECSVSYTTREVDPQYGTHGPDKVTYKFIFYPLDGSPIPMTMVVDHFSDNIVQSDDMIHITSQYKDIEGKVGALQTVGIFVDIAIAHLEDRRVDWIEKMGGKKVPTDYILKIIEA